MKKVNFVISSPGKVILFGEHSVVYGEPAIAASIDKRTRVIFEHSDTDFLFLHLKSFDLLLQIELEKITTMQASRIPLNNKDQFAHLTLENPEIIDHLVFVDYIQTHVETLVSEKDRVTISALSVVFFLLWGMFNSANKTIRCAKITVESDLTMGAGTGSSASYAVSLAASFYYYIQLANGKFDENVQTFTKEDKEIINKWALECERMIHGLPSGLDNYVCTFGGIVQMYTNDETKDRTIEKAVDEARLKMLLVYTGVPRSTFKMVSHVSKLRSRMHAIVDHLLELMGDVAITATETIKKITNLQREDKSFAEVENETTNLQDLIDINQGLLVSLGVSHRCINEIVDLTSQYNLHSKLTGAGGGGYVITFVPDSMPDSVVTECIEALEKNYTVTHIILGESGVKIDSVGFLE